MPTILNSIFLRYISVSFSSAKTRCVEIDTSGILVSSVHVSVLCGQVSC